MRATQQLSVQENVTIKVGTHLARVVESRFRVLGPLHVHVEAGLFYVWLSLKFASVQQVASHILSWGYKFSYHSIG